LADKAAAENVTTVMGDKGYDSDALRSRLSSNRIESLIPTRTNRINRPLFKREQYKQRNVIERFIGKLKENRRVATRYDKKASHYEAFVVLAALKSWLNFIC
jgi:Transposase and inactivated derivatives